MNLCNQRPAQVLSIAICSRVKHRDTAFFSDCLQNMFSHLARITETASSQPLIYFVASIIINNYYTSRTLRFIYKYEGFPIYYPSGFPALKKKVVKTAFPMCVM